MRRLRYKVVRGKCPDHVPDTLGEYDPNTSTIRLYVDNIRRRAKVWYCSYADLKQMVMLHEESHAKTDHLNLPTTQDELVADALQPSLLGDLLPHLCNQCPDILILCRLRRLCGSAAAGRPRKPDCD